MSQCPPGPGKWEPIDPRLFAGLTGHGRGRPRPGDAARRYLIGSPRTATGRKGDATRADHAYPTRLRVAAEEMARIDRVRHACPGGGDHTLKPSPPPWVSVSP